MADLPRGAVTFLFTDIEGSTRLVKQLRDRYGEVLGEHQRLLREAFDAVTAGTRSTRRATRSSSRSRARGTPCWRRSRRSARSRTTRGRTVRRSGSGWASTRARHRRPTAGTRGSPSTVRPVSARPGHGGQVLVSQATQTLLEDEEEDSHVGLRDLGAAAAQGSRPPGPPLPGRARRDCRPSFRRYAGRKRRRSSRRPRLDVLPAGVARSGWRLLRWCSPRSARGRALLATRGGGGLSPSIRTTSASSIRRRTDRRGGDGRHTARARRGRRGLGLGREPRRPDVEAGRCSQSRRTPARSRSRTRRRRGSPTAREPFGWPTAFSASSPVSIGSSAR